MKIQEIIKKFDQLDELNQKASDEINKAKEDSIKKIVKVTRAGKEVEVTEKDLWDEVYHQAQTDARDVLREKYPEAFNTSEEAQKLAEEIQTNLANEFDLPTNRENLVGFGKLIKFVVGLYNKGYGN